MLINVVLVGLFAIFAFFIQNPMVMMLFNGLIILSMGLGLIFFFGTSVGMLRFPDFFTRLHAAGKGDTLSTVLILFSCALYSIQTSHHIDKDTILTAIKILLIINFIFLGSPTSSHALIDAGFSSEVKPWKKKNKS